MSKSLLCSMIKLSSLTLVLFLALQSAALADVVEGRVSQTSPKMLSMVVYDAQGRPYSNELNLKIDSQTEFQGISSVGTLQTNDAISANVRQEEPGIWRADRVTLFQKPGIKPATQNASSPLKDVLGNPVARGALLGAATGAIASAASGGKAGKGALIGAGAGAAAGLLQGLFEQHPRKSSDTDNR